MCRSAQHSWPSVLYGTSAEVLALLLALIRNYSLCNKSEKSHVASVSWFVRIRTQTEFLAIGVPGTSTAHYPFIAPDLQAPTSQLRCSLLFTKHLSCETNSGFLHANLFLTTDTPALLQCILHLSGSSKNPPDQVLVYRGLEAALMTLVFSVKYPITCT